MTDKLMERAKTMLGTIEYAKFHRISPAYPDAEVERIIRDLVVALESARSYKSLPAGMVWQDYYSPDDVLKIRQPLDDEIEQLRAGGPWVEHVETIRALQESRHGGCICDCNPDTTNGPEEYCSHHGRPYYEAVDRLTAEIDRLVQQHREFTDKLGYGDGVTEPAAELAELVDPIKAAFSEARDHNECPRLCEPCGERLASTLCPECRGSGCHNAMCEASGAYRECEYCAGVGWVHEGCVETSYADLAAQAEVVTRPVEDPGWQQTDTGVTSGGKPIDWCPKWLRECLCAQATNAPDARTRSEIGRLIRLLDLHRPLRNDGKHRTLHTPTCGCDDR